MRFHFGNWVQAEDFCASFQEFDVLTTCHVPPRSRYSLCSAAGFDVMCTRNELRIEEEEEEEE